MKFTLGMPGVETLAIADTGSDLTWVQCKPCIKCFKQKSPIFDPQRSSTYKPVPCASNTCSYTIMYGDNSYSKGNIAIETITLGGNVSIGNLTIGCGHLDQGTFGAGSSGIVGLGGGKVSLISQMGPSIEGKFSYCLVPFFGESSKPSKMNFGENVVVSGDSVVSTPIVAKSPSTFYFLTLEGITVGSQRLDLNSSSSLSSSSNDDDDSGTTLTFLPVDLYYQVITAVRSQMTLREISDPQGLLKLCYFSIRNEIPKVPEITAHFRGADVKLKSVNTFVKTSGMSLCLAFAPASSFAIYGNLAQMNFLVGYDLKKKTVSFKPTVCSKA
ncbi:aspartic proteinase cdr1 [Phtheirospermum japonicum]|uniref:Aspartic proteinase cdr1 n=1 Tax=Phtheirospermum japonicum TaxID=374723 RepID=A0A830BW78_9LAMI|nr:aspartic proteinase cdr1 [Phtheirospermum japonicum]